MDSFDRFVPMLLRVSSSVMIWAVHFLVIYGVTALACARRLDTVHWLGIGIVPWVVGVATAAAVSATLWLGLKLLRGIDLDRSGLRAGDLLVSDRGRLAPWLAVTIAALTIVAMLWEALPVILVPACG